MGAIQHELFPFETGVSRELLSDLLNDGAPQPVKLTITTNRVTMASIDFSSDSVIKVRLHEEFLRAPREVVDALRTYFHSRSKSDWDTVATYAWSIVGGRPRPARRTKPNTAGSIYNLKDVKDEVNKNFFNRRVSCGIEWSRARPAGRRGRKSRSIRFGTWDPEQRTIRINPLLDDERVPYDFVRYIVFHEMLHVVVPEVRRDGRRYYHPSTFKRLERSFPNLPKMHGLAKELVDVLT